MSDGNPRFCRSLQDMLVAPTATIRDAVARIGTITDGDVRRGMLAGIGMLEPARALVDRQARPTETHPLTAPADTSDEALLHLMNETGIRQIPLLDADGRVVDLALLRDLARDYEQPLRAMIMAGGRGQRLRPLTAETPKPMLPIGDKPLMERVIDGLRAAGIHKVNVTTHFQPEKITDYFGTGRDFGVELNYVNEDEPLGTAGAIGLLDDFDETLLLINGDVLTGIDFQAMHDFHRAHGADLTVAVRRHEMTVPYGVIDSDGVYVQAVREKPTYTVFVNAGVYLIEPSVRRHVPRNVRLDMTDLIERVVAADGTVVSFPIREYWRDVGRHDDYDEAQRDAQNGVLHS